MQKNYGLFFTKKDKEDTNRYLFRAYYTIDELNAGIESKAFQSIEKEKIFIVKLSDEPDTTEEEDK